MKDFSFITHSHPAYIENLYKDFVQNPESVDPDYRKFFEGFDFAINSVQNGNGKPAEDLNDKAAALSPESMPAMAMDSNQLLKELAVYNLILAYRRKGHLLAKTNPIRERKNRVANLDLKYFGLSETDLTESFAAARFIGLGTTTLQNILDKLQKIYTGHIGIEYQYVLKQNRIEWL
jgi:2-oxoglutarate dehydrogenase E1 component